MNKADFTLHFPMPLSEQDWANLAASKVTRVMLPLTMADQTTLGRLAKQGVRVVIRVEEGRYSDDISRYTVRRQMQAVGNVANVSGVVVGCEPDALLDWTYGASTWGQDAAYRHMSNLAQMAQLLKHDGFFVISPGWKMRSISEDEPPQPGAQTWAEIVRLQYDALDGNGFHLYEYGWEGPVDELRVKFALKAAQERFHHLLWIDELGVNQGAAIERMRAYIDIAQLLIEEPIGRRVTMLCPFVSNGDPGNPPQWDSHYLLSDPQSYVELGDWIAPPV